MPEYTPQRYPGWRYHEDGRSRIIHTDEEHEALHAEGWRDTPAAFEAAEPAEPAEPEEPAEEPKTEEPAEPAPAKTKRK